MVMDKVESGSARASSEWRAFGRVMSRHKRLLVIVPLLAMVIAAVVLQFVPNQYTAVLKIAPSGPAQLYLWALREDSLTNSIIKKFNLVHYFGDASLEKTRRKLESKVQFVSNLQDNFVDVRVIDKDPEMAKNLANAYGDGMIGLLLGLHLTDASKAIYALQSRREQAVKSLSAARAKLERSDVKQAQRFIPSSTRVGVIGMAGIQAETTLSTGLLQPAQNDLARQSLDPAEIVRLQERLASIQRTLADDIQIKKSGVPLGSLVAAVDALQDEAYWEAMVDRIDRRISVLQATERDEVRLIHATTPDSPSGPKRLMLAVLAGLATLLVAVVYVLGIDQFRGLWSTD
jgi:capsular polysaccharide biosynthesis protein